MPDRLKRDSGFACIFLIGAAFAALFLGELIQRVSDVRIDGGWNYGNVYTSVALVIGYLAWLLWLLPAFFRQTPVATQRIAEASLALLAVFTLICLPLIFFLWPWYIWNTIVSLFLLNKENHMREIRGRK